MTTEPDSILTSIWRWAKANDLPNWIVLLFTGIAWPLVLHYWHKKKVNSIPGLEVRLGRGTITINGAPFGAVDIEFINHTGSVVYISGAQVRNCTPDFPVPIEASRDIAQNSHHLKFLNQAGQYADREITLQTNASAKASIAVKSPRSESFYSFSAPWYRRVFRVRKYFLLEYVAMVGRDTYSVSTTY